MRTSLRMILAAALCVMTLGSVAVAAPQGGQLPLAGVVVRGFDPPAEKWGAGHRGIDLGGAVGDDVVAPAAGRVTFAGNVAGRPVVVISHGDRRSTLEPVRATSAVGDLVEAGDVVGTLVAGHACASEACLHWGVREGDVYLDPLSFINASQVRLLPDDAAAAVEERAQARAAQTADAGLRATGTGTLGIPTDGPITSRFGPRFHPIFHEWRVHAGVDISAPCGTPIRAADDGVVTHAAWDSSGGWRLIIDHGTVDGVPLQTVYLHAQGYTVRRGQQLRRGEPVGTVGSTGWSTGCHLHFSVKAAGQHVDPEAWLS